MKTLVARTLRGLRDPKITLKKFMWVPFLRPFPGNETHKLFSGGPNRVFWVGGKKFTLKKNIVFS